MVIVFYVICLSFFLGTCGVPDRIPYAEPKPGALNQNIFLPNATVSYVCRPGYTRVFGKKNSLTCLENYKWSEPEVFCQRKYIIFLASAFLICKNNGMDS